MARCTRNVESSIQFYREAADTRPFEIDLFATLPIKELSLLSECNYHDESRFWMFLPATEPMNLLDGNYQFLRMVNPDFRDIKLFADHVSSLLPLSAVRAPNVHRPSVCHREDLAAILGESRQARPW